MHRKSFTDIPYYVSEDAKRTLLQACMLGVVSGQVSAEIVPEANQNTHPHGEATELTPPLGRILIRTSIQNSGYYQKAVAEALALQMKVRTDLTPNVVCFDRSPAGTSCSTNMLIRA